MHPSKACFIFPHQWNFYGIPISIIFITTINYNFITTINKKRTHLHSDCSSWLTSLFPFSISRWTLTMRLVTSPGPTWKIHLHPVSTWPSIGSTFSWLRTATLASFVPRLTKTWSASSVPSAHPSPRRRELVIGDLLWSSKIWNRKGMHCPWALTVREASRQELYRWTNVSSWTRGSGASYSERWWESITIKLWRREREKWYPMRTEVETWTRTVMAISPHDVDYHQWMYRDTEWAEGRVIKDALTICIDKLDIYNQRHTVIVSQSTASMSNTVFMTRHVFYMSF